MLQVQDRLLNLLTCSPVHCHCATAASSVAAMIFWCWCLVEKPRTLLWLLQILIWITREKAGRSSFQNLLPCDFCVCVQIPGSHARQSGIMEIAERSRSPAKDYAHNVQVFVSGAEIGAVIIRWPVYKCFLFPVSDDHAVSIIDISFSLCKLSEGAALEKLWYGGLQINRLSDRACFWNCVSSQNSCDT